MKNLEDKILKKVYQFEANRTLFLISLELVSILLLVLALVVFGQVIIEILVEQKTLDLFQLFGEDFEAIRRYFFDTVYILYLEVPKILLLFWLLFLASLSFLTLTLVKNFSKIKNRVVSLLKYWL